MWERAERLGGHRASVQMAVGMLALLPVLAVAQVAPAPTRGDVHVEGARVGERAFLVEGTLLRSSPGGAGVALSRFVRVVPTVVRRSADGWVTVTPVEVDQHAGCFDAMTPWPGFELDFVVAEADLVPVLTQSMTVRGSNSTVEFHAGSRVALARGVVEVLDASGALVPNARVGRSYPSPPQAPAPQAPVNRAPQTYAGEVPPGVVVVNVHYLEPGVRVGRNRARFEGRCLTLVGPSRPAWGEGLGNRQAARPIFGRPQGLIVVGGSEIFWTSGARAGRTVADADLADGVLRVLPNGNYCGLLPFTEQRLELCAAPAAFRGFEPGFIPDLPRRPASDSSPTPSAPRPVPSAPNAPD